MDQAEEQGKLNRIWLEEAVDKDEDSLVINSRFQFQVAKVG